MTVKTCSCGKTTVEFPNLKAEDFPSPWVLECCEEAAKSKKPAPVVVAEPEAAEPTVKESLTVPETKPVAKKVKN